jgi:hypothetical protein
MKKINVHVTDSMHAKSFKGEQTKLVLPNPVSGHALIGLKAPNRAARHEARRPG